MVVAIIATLISLLLPSLRQARLQAKMVVAHADLRSITMAMHMYLDENRGKLPPSRISCGMRTEYELPLELSDTGYLPTEKKDNGLAMTGMRDIFSPTDTYKFRAPGPVIMNETQRREDYQMWIPDDAPTCASDDGQYYRDPRKSPIRYAVWSTGVQRDWLKTQPVWGHAPLPQRFWCKRVGEPGLIVHYVDDNDNIHMSP